MIIMVKKEKKAEHILMVRLTEKQKIELEEMIELSPYITISSFVRSKIFKSPETKIDEILRILEEQTK